MTGQLRGKTALITGAASGIGLAIAELYAQEGATVALADRNVEGCRAALERLPGNTQHTAHVLDVADAYGIKAMVEEVVEQHERIDVLVNSAGILTEVPLLEMDPETFDEMIAVNLRGTFMCCRWTAPYMVRQNGGRIINIASQIGLKGGVNLTHYTAAKAGVIGMTKAMARELATHNVLVNVIAPGPILTPLFAGLSDKWQADKQAELPLGRFGKAHEVAPSALLLASSPGGDLFMGQTLGPNSGDVMP